MVRVCVLALVATVRLLSAAPLHRAGDMIFEDFRKIPWLTEVRHVPVLPGRACADSIVRVDLSGQMPPVGDQGAQGSCVAWAVAYNHVTHNEWVEHHWNVNDPQYQFSPAFTYNQINGGGDNGTSGSAAMELVCEQGVSSMADFPYNQYNCTLWPTESAYSHAIRFRADAGFWIGTRDTTGQDMIKQRLVNGYTSCLGISVWGNFDRIDSFHDTYCSCQRRGSNRGGHAVTIVGYDDTMTTADGPGAFKLVNSWGTGWDSLHGYFWMSYVALTDTLLCSGYAFYVTNRVGYQPTLLGRVKITHPARDRIGIRLGMGPTQHPVWSQDFRQFRWANVDQPFPAHNMVFDMSGGERFFRAGLADTFFARAIDDTADSKTGTIDFFSCQDLLTSLLVVSPDPPDTIPDAHVPAYSRAVLGAAGPATCLSYDDGTVGGGWAWLAADYGFGGVFAPPGYPCLIVGASFDFYPSSWPVPGSNEIVVRVLADDGPDGSPGTELYSSDTLHVVRGDWTYVPLPESVIGAINSGRFYVFEVQVGAYPDCPGLSVDNDGPTMPSPWWGTGNSTYSPIDTPPGDYMIRAFVTSPTGVRELSPAAPSRPGLALAAPSHFVGNASISYVLPREDNVELAVIDVAGRQVQMLVHGRQKPGTYRLVWNPRAQLGPGVYFLRLKTGSGARTRKTLRVG
jgi:hypothetical protein